MFLNSFRLLLLLTVTIGPLKARAYTDQKYHTLAAVEVSQVRTDVFDREIAQILFGKNLDENAGPIPGISYNKSGQNLGNLGQILYIGSELVALGEGVYSLIQRGKPTNLTQAAPISVLPKVGRRSVDIFETENWKVPAKVTYQVVYKNLYGMEVVKFKYMVVFSYGGSYQGRGAYITAAQIIPLYIQTSYGFDFSASMKLNGVQNHGTKSQPLAGAIITLEYRVETFLQATLQSKSYHITGKGGFRAI